MATISSALTKRDGGREADFEGTALIARKATHGDARAAGKVAKQGIDPVDWPEPSAAKAGTPLVKLTSTSPGLN